jgi:hypothetical protein
MVLIPFPHLSVDLFVNQARKLGSGHLNARYRLVVAHTRLARAKALSVGAAILPTMPGLIATRSTLPL